MAAWRREASRQSWRQNPDPNPDLPRLSPLPTSLPLISSLTGHQTNQEPQKAIRSEACAWCLIPETSSSPVTRHPLSICVPGESWEGQPFLGSGGAKPSVGGLGKAGSREWAEEIRWALSCFLLRRCEVLAAQGSEAGAWGSRRGQAPWGSGPWGPEPSASPQEHMRNE